MVPFMQRLLLILLLSLSTFHPQILAGEAQVQGQIREGLIVYVKPNSMWFLSDTALSTWQKDEAHLSPEALKTHQDDVLGSREAWQFGNQQRVKVLKMYTNRPDE